MSRTRRRRLRLYHQALAAFSAGGVVSGKAAVIGNLGVTYLALGLFHRARRLLLESDRLQRDLGNRLGVVTNGWNLFATELMLRHPEAARTAASVAALTREIGARRFAGSCVARGWNGRDAGRPYSGRGRGFRSRRGATRVGRRRPADGIPQPVRPCMAGGRPAGEGAGVLAARDRAAPRQGARVARRIRPAGDVVVAPRSVARQWQGLGSAGGARAGVPFRPRFRFGPERRRAAPQRAQQEAGDPRDRPRVARARDASASCRRRSARRISRRRATCASRSSGWSTRGCGSTNCAAPTNCRRSWSTRRRSLPAPSELLLVLEAADGARIAGSLLPEGEDADALLRAIAAVARRGAPHACRRSCATRRRALPRWTSARISSRRWSHRTRCWASSTPTSTAPSAASTTPTATSSACSPRRPPSRSTTRAGRRGSRQGRGAHRRARRSARGELTIINSIQQGISGSLDFQGIVELVGDKLREVLKSDDIGIDWIDHETRAHPDAVRDRARQAARGSDRTWSTSDENWARICARRIPLVQNTVAEISRDWGWLVPGTDLCRSRVSVPIVVGDQRDRRDRHGEPRARIRVRRVRGAPADHDRVVDGRGAAERAPVRRDAAAAEGNRAARRRAGGDQQHPAGHRGGRSTSRPSSTWSATSCARCCGPTTSASAWYDDEDGPRPLPLRVRARQAASTVPRLRRPAGRSDQMRDTRSRDRLQHGGRAAAASASALVPGTDRAQSVHLRADRRRRPRARPLVAREPRARARVRRSRDPAADDRRLVDGRRARERAPVRRDAAAAEGDRAARRRARRDQQHPAGHRRRRSTSRASSTWSATSCARCSHTRDMGIALVRPGREPGPLPVRRTSTASGSTFRRARSGRAASPRRIIATRSRCVFNTLAEMAAAGHDRRARHRPGAVAHLRADRRRRPRARRDRRSRTTSASTRSANPKCACCRRSPRRMGVALENARLFDETQRLLKETEQRAAEMAVINSIQQGIAGELDFQAIVDLVGDKLREVLKTGDIGIALARAARPDLLHSLYVYEHGERLRSRRVAPMPGRTVRNAWSQTRHAAGLQHAWPSNRRLGISRRSGTDRAPVVRDGSDHRQRSRAGRSSTWRTTSASTRSAKPRCGCSPPWPPAWASRSRTRACSRRSSAARAKARRWPKWAATSRRRSTSPR